MNIFKRKPKKPPKLIMARFIYYSNYHEIKSEWQVTTVTELKKAISINDGMFSATIKLGNLYQPNCIVQGFETKGFK